MARQGKKQKARLKARITSWEKGNGSNENEKNKLSNANSMWMRKPGSNKK